MMLALSRRRKNSVKMEKRRGRTSQDEGSDLFRDRDAMSACIERMENLVQLLWISEIFLPALATGV